MAKVTKPSMANRKEGAFSVGLLFWAGIPIRFHLCRPASINDDQSETHFEDCLFGNLSS